MKRVLGFTSIFLAAGLTSSCDSSQTHFSASQRGYKAAESANATSNLKPESEKFSFDTKAKASEAFVISLDDEKLATSFMLKNIYSDKEDTSDQLTRTPMTKMATQGTPGEDKTEMFQQADKRGLLDLLIVMDNSGSMGQEQANISTKLSSLLSSISDTDWQIAVISTDPNDNCNISIVRSGDNDANNLFKNAVTLGTNGSGNEQGIRRAVVGLKCESTPWVRNNSSVAVLIVSDEDNCSYNSTGCQNQPWAETSYLTNYIENTMNREIGKSAGIYGLFSDPDDSCNTAYKDAPVYKQLVQYKSNGQKNYGDICDNDYSTTLKLISDNIAKIIKAQWDLQYTPDDKSLSLEIDQNGTKTSVLESYYTLSDKTITFTPGNEPPLGSKVVASYTVGKKPMFQVLELQKKPAKDTVKVMINGQNLDAGKYQIVEKEIRFDEEPAANSTVAVHFREDTPLMKEFNVTGKPKEDKVMVYVNDELTNKFAYNAAEKKVVFEKEPSDGAKIRIAYENLDGPQLDYSVMILGQNPRDFSLYYGEEELNFEHGELSQIRINAADHMEDRTLILKYEVDDTEEKSFEISHVLVEDSLRIEGGDGICSLGDGFSFDGNTLTSTCIVEEATDFKISYERSKTTNEFIIKTGLSLDGVSWRVTVDGQATENFDRDGNRIIIHEDLESASNVTIYLDVRAEDA